jgi:hypothetical protein
VYLDEGDNQVEKADLEGSSVSDIVCYKYAMLVSCDVGGYIFSIKSVP